MVLVGAYIRKTGTNNQQNFFWIGNNTVYGRVGIFVAKKWIEKVIEVKHVSERILIVKLKTDKRNTSAMFACALQQDLGNYKKSVFLKKHYTNNCKH